MLNVWTGRRLLHLSSVFYRSQTVHEWIHISVIFISKCWRQKNARKCVARLRQKRLISYITVGSPPSLIRLLRALR